jgi:hypothetical protein
LATQDEFLDLVWQSINLPMQEHWIENSLRYAENDPNAPFADVGPALQRLLAAGASRRDLSLIVRHACYEEAFNVLSLLSDPGIDDNEVEDMHASLLAADPSGKEGRPGSAPLLPAASPGKSARKKPKASSASKPKSAERKLLKGGQKVCFSPDGAMLATLGRGLTLWKCPEIEQVAKVSTLSNSNRLAFSPDSKRLAVKNTSGRIVLIDTSTHNMTADFRNEADGEGSNVLFSDDGEHVIDASWAGSHFVRSLDGTIVFREVFKGDMVTDVLRHPDGRYWFRHIRPDERLIGRARPFKPGEYEKLTVSEDPYEHATFSPDGQILAISAGFKPRAIYLLSFPTLELVQSVELPSLGMGHGFLCFSPCGRLLGVVGDVVAVLNAKTLETIDEIPIEYGADIAFSPTAPLMAVGSSSVGEVFDTSRYLGIATDGASSSR